MRAGPSRFDNRLVTISSQLLVTGVHTSGRGPSLDSSHPRTSASAAAPDDLATTATSAQCPWTAVIGHEYARAISLRRSAFSEEDTTVTRSQPARDAAAGDPPEVTERAITMRTAPIAAAAT